MSANNVKVKKEGSKKSIGDIAAEAAAAGMTYGKYVVMMNNKSLPRCDRPPSRKLKA